MKRLKSPAGLWTITRDGTWMLQASEVRTVLAGAAIVRDRPSPPGTIVRLLDEHGRIRRSWVMEVVQVDRFEATAKWVRQYEHEWLPLKLRTRLLPVTP